MTKFAFVAAERGKHAVATLCRIVGVSVSGFYAWLHAIPFLQRRAEAEADLRGHIERIFAARCRVYGSPRIHAELRHEGRRHGKRRIERLMREMACPPASAAAGSRVPPTAGTLCRSPPTCWRGPSLPSGRIRCGWPISVPSYSPHGGDSLADVA